MLSTDQPDYARLLTGLDAIDLSHAWFPGMPASPNHPPYLFTLARRHGDATRDDGTCTADELIVLSGHTGTHIDALGHASHEGRLHGELDAGTAQAGGRGLRELGIETVPPLVCRGVLLDVAGARGVACLAPGEEVTPADLESAEARAGTRVTAGDAALIRTGWGRHWPDPERFVGAASGTPGPGPAAADWLVDRGVALTGDDTLAYEVIRPDGNVRPVHGRLLVDAGIYIMEALNLEELAAAGPGTFLLVVAPLRLVGATGSPVRPLALYPAAPTVGPNGQGDG